MRVRSLALSIPAVLALTCAARAAYASELVLDRLAPGAIKLDGKTKEWPPSTPASESIAPGGGSAEVHAGYDEVGLWIAAEVHKSGPVAHSATMGDGDDCVSLVIAFPRENQVKSAPDRTSYEVGFYPGQPGVSTGGVRFRGGSGIAGAKIIEAPSKDGYTVEGFVPWSAFPEAKRVRAGLRGAMRVYFGNGSRNVGIRATAVGSGETLPALPIEPEVSLPTALASRKQSLRDVRWDVSADFMGESMDERLLVVGDAFYLLGPNVREGKQWMAFDVGGSVAGLEVRDVTGDGKADLLVTTKVYAGSSKREALSVWSFVGEKPTRVFAHETAIEGANGEWLRDQIAFGAGKKPSIAITYAAPKGFSVDRYREPTASDVDPILLPWGAVKERDFVWSGGMFVRDREVAQKAEVARNPAAPPSSISIATTGPAASAAPTGAKSPAVIAPDANAAIARFVKDRAIVGTPRWESSVELGGTGGKAALYGRDLVVAPGGGAFAFVTMSRYAKDADVLEVVAKDVTGDGRDDFLVRGLVRASVEGPGGSREVVREILTIYVTTGTASAGGGFSLRPLGAFELSRAVGDAKVESSYRVLAGKPPTLEISRGSAKGWTEKTWPFGAERKTDVEPVLLPWAARSTARWTFRGDGFSSL
jgi:hypothetical protein